MNSKKRSRSVWPIAILAAVFFYCVIAFGLPLLVGTIPGGLGIENPEAGNQIAENARQPFHLAGLVAAGVILVQPILAKFRR